MTEFLYKRCRNCREQVLPADQLLTECRHTLCRGCWTTIIARSRKDLRNPINKCPLCGSKPLRLMQVGSIKIPAPEKPSAMSPREKAATLIARGFSLDDIDALLADLTSTEVPGYSRERVVEFRGVVRDIY